ncbi:hypothetical protein COCOBI_19-0380 [Coccomyxa sp. Obi]|nr:hypothetical protein COCOBI_19-0380 [Coccomyxa sp. Obi]
MQEGPLMGRTKNQKIRVVDSIINATKGAVEDLFAGIKHDNVNVRPSSSTTQTTTAQPSSTPQTQASTMPLSSSTPFVLPSSTLMSVATLQPSTTPQIETTSTPMSSSASSGVLPSATPHASNTPMTPPNTTIIPSTTPNGACASPNGTLFNFPNGTITLRTCSATGSIGPTATMCQQMYTLIDPAYSCILQSFFGVINNGTQALIVPKTASYNITVAGARGGRTTVYQVAGGAGALITVATTLLAGDQLYAVVAQQGVATSYQGGGGGASFLFRCTGSILNCTLLVAAGGGGGAGFNFKGIAGPVAGSLTINGTDSSPIPDDNKGPGFTTSIAGGVNGSPGAPNGQRAQGGTGDDNGGGGGGGSVGNVMGSYLGGLGIGSDDNGSPIRASGGFGAGGGAGYLSGGGGGGYSGGGGGAYAVPFGGDDYGGGGGGGGGTFTAADTFIVNQPTLNPQNDGFITMSYVPVF